MPEGGSWRRTWFDEQPPLRDVTVTTRPADSSWDLAAAQGVPSRFGIGKGGGPTLTVRVTELPFGTLAPGGGLWVSTVSGAASLSTSWRAALSPAFFRVAWAWA